MACCNDAKIEYKNPSIEVHTFTANVAERPVKFEVLKFKDSIFLWIGEKQCRTFNDLSLALSARGTAECISSKIIGQPTDLTSSNLAIKLTKKLGKPVYVSFNLVEDRLTVPVINSRIAEEIVKNPQFFT